MQLIQRGEAIELLISLTDMEQDDIDRHADYQLQAWLYELGFEWHPNVGLAGAWLPIPEPTPEFGSIVRPADTGNLGPLFESV